MRTERIKYRKTGDMFPLFLLFVLTIFSFAGKIYALDIPRPPDTELVEKGAPQYRSLLTQGEILAFYQRELARKGWKIIDASPQQTSGFAFPARTFSFAKGGDTLTLVFSPFTAEGFVFYTINTAGRAEADSQPEAEGLSLGRVFKDPEFLDFMPVHPGSKQVSYGKNASGVHVSYMLDGEVDEVKKFYLKGMLRYGWRLVSRKRMGGEETKIKPEITGATLEFKREGETCTIVVAKAGGISSFGAGDLTSLGLGDIMIAVVYEKK